MTDKILNKIIINEEYATRLLDLLNMEKKLCFVFRTGFCKEWKTTGHQYPLTQDFLKKHKVALNSIDMIYTVEDGIIYAMVRIRYVLSIERAEYMIKRALLDLSECYGWNKLR